MKLALPAILIAAIVTSAAPADASVLTGVRGTQVASQFSLQGAKLGSFFTGITLTDVATGDVTGDGTEDLVLAGAQQIAIRDGRTNAVVRTLKLGRGFAAASVDAGDVTGDGRADIVVAGGSVRVYDGSTGAYLRAFTPYASTGGVSVAVGDLEGDGRAEIATAAGRHVKVFGADGTTLRSFFAYDPATTAPVDIAVGDATGDGHADLVTVPGAGAPPLVRVFVGTTLVRAFFAGDPSSTAGASVAVGDARIVIAAGSTIRVIDAATLATTAYFMPFGPAAGHIAIAA